MSIKKLFVCFQSQVFCDVECKLVFVVRNDLKMKKGKIAAQVCIQLRYTFFIDSFPIFYQA